MNSSTNGSTVSSGDFWAQEDAVTKDRDAADAALNAALNGACGALETIDGAITDLSGLAFGAAKPMTRSHSNKTTKKKSKKQRDQVTAPCLTQEEIEAYELEALQALVEGREPRVPAKVKNASRSNDPPTGRHEVEETAQEEKIPMNSVVDNDEASDLRELEIEINHYIDMIKKHNDLETMRKHENLTERGKRQDDVMELLKDVEKRHEEQQLEQFQYRRQNKTSEDEHQIWSYVGDYYTGGVSRPTNPNRIAPSPENMLGRMVPRQETEESREARVSKMLDALDSRVAKQNAARKQYDDDELERALQRRQQREHLSDNNVLLLLLQDLKLVKSDEDDDRSESTASTRNQEKHLTSTLDELDKEFYVEIKEAAKEEYNSSENVEENGIVVASSVEQGPIFENGCLGCGQQPEDPGTINGVPRTLADTTNAIDSQQVACSPVDSQDSDASEGSSNAGNRNKKDSDNKQDPPENSWFPFLSLTPKKPEAVIPKEITLGDPPEEIREEPEEVKAQVHVKKGLKIVAVLEGNNNEEVQVGTATKPIMVGEQTTEAPGLTRRWIGSEQNLHNQTE
ncbi:MAG: hypothetical protein SGBAC_010737 [Bacillariaceae sp.]